MTVDRLRQIALDTQLLLWDLPLWIIEDIIWKCKVSYKRHDWEDNE
jgi:hypothetical protein